MQLKRLRELAKLTQTELATKAGIGQGHVSALELGRYANPSMETVERLANALDCTIPEIMAAIRETHQAVA